MIEISKKEKKKASMFFLEKDVQKRVFQFLSIIYRQYTKEQKLVSEKDNDGKDIEDIPKKYEIFATQVELLGSLLTCEDTKTCFTKIIYDPRTADVLSIINNKLTDPKLLKSLCFLANQVLSHRSMNLDDEVNKKAEEQEDEKLIRDLSKKVPKLWKDLVGTRMGHCVNLLPYLGLDMYKNMLEKLAEHDKDDDGGDKKNGKKRIETDLTKQTNLVVHELFIEIIKLIEFFCAKLADIKNKPEDMQNKEDMKR